MPAKNFSTKTLPKNSPFTPYPTQLLLQAPWNEFLRENGYAKLSQNLKLQVFYQLDKVHEIWEQFSPKSSVFDLWDSRNAFFQAYKFDPYFLTLLKQKGADKDILGILPLWHNTDKLEPGDDPSAVDCGKYVWFGSSWPEDNVFFVKNPELIPLLLTAAPENLELACIKPKIEYDFLRNFHGFVHEEEKKYYLDLTHIKTLDDYLAKLKKKKRYNLRRDRKRILALSPKLIVNEKGHLEELFSLSIKRFREVFPDEPNEHSAFEDERRKNVFRNLLNNAHDYQTRTITTMINGKIEAVEFGLVYKKTYYALNAGADISRYSGIGVFSNLLVLEDALKLGCTKIDFLEGDNNWKDSWHLDYYYQYQFMK